MSVAKSRVCVAMSGGVDSSVAAFLLKQEGHEVIGLTFRNWPQDCLSRAEDKCCGPQAVRDARMVAHSLGIPHYVIDEVDGFQREVIDYFVGEYRRGRTPNPCILCNEKIKFGSLLNRARGLGADRIATGHYARISRHPVELRKGRDPTKDQSYFLFSLRREQLGAALMPLGDLDKRRTRQVARELGLRTHAKVESQEICFVPDEDYRRFLREGAGLPDRPGDIVAQEGRVLGRHNGIEFFTVGQREGLRIGGLKEPVYVVGLDPAANRVIVGPEEALRCDEFTVARCNWLAIEPPATPLDCTVKIRSNHPGCAATVESLGDGRARVQTRPAQRAVTPGQAAVFYQDDLVLGGGWIE